MHFEFGRNGNTVCRPQSAETDTEIVFLVYQQEKIVYKCIGKKTHFANFMANLKIGMYLEHNK